ncbi:MULTISPECIES: glycine cleavage system protein GcvH [Rothia]|uniref:Glycine cleavage system H protein n=2 Tax=Rothia TaxID=32207 RepID=A0A4Y9F5T5_9MICC|nr:MULTISPECIES: glycine cleavage system protein GcvH [Rothia]MBF0807471.1 glycine cleavage system protein GcvH [Rothia nasimurium]TFU23765.1 glycine cleavage system protein GcvH [Rothia nasimurium]WHS49799.1 glycine cleavage system protein GcvH [Rothia sp. SD9660Na]HIY94255.1 glycine cleavage system protein GcvH [Candidatus Rothia avicola]
MSNVPAELKYTKEHEWVSELTADGTVRIGVTDHAQSELGDVVYVDLPEVGETIDAEATFGEIESTKSVSDLFAPIAGEVVAVNEDLADAPETVNSDPYGAGWLIEVRPNDAADIEGLLSAADYEAEIA